MMGLCVVMMIVNFGGDAGKCADKLDISSMHVQWFSHQKCRADICHEMTSQGSLMLLGRELYEKSEHKPRGCHLGFHN